MTDLTFIDVATGAPKVTGTPQPIDDQPAGADSTVLQVEIRYRWGQTGGDPLTDLLLVVQTQDPATPGTGVATGVPPQDELWPSVRFVGHDPAGDPTQVPHTTPWHALGAYRALPFPSLHAGCSRTVEIKFRPPGSAAAGAWTWYLLVWASEHARALPLPTLDAGILHGVGDPERTELVRGGAVSVSSPADDQVHVAIRQVLWRGRLRGEPAASVALDQTATGGALAAGESYWAALTQGDGVVTVTKGDGDAAPTYPTPPAEPFLAWVRVDHQGGPSVIEAEDVAGLRQLGRHHAEPGDGLELIVHPGQALGAGAWRFWSRPDRLPLDPNATAYLHQEPSGFYTLSADARPMAGQLGPWWRVTTDANDVTALDDLRTLAGRDHVLHLTGSPAATGLLAEIPIAHRRLDVDRVIAQLSDAGSGTAGRTLLDVQRVRGGVATTLYPSGDAERPSFAFDAVDLRHADGIPEVCDLETGDVLQLHVLELPTGGAAPARVDLLIPCLY
ncbi:MAG: hypothetical protein AAGN66_17815 [Acidobacteriota bacterium]